jgi:hypothetical protein
MAGRHYRSRLAENVDDTPLQSLNTGIKKGAEAPFYTCKVF